jgi:hypothetical protein
MLDPTGKLKPITKLDENEAAAIAKLEGHGEFQAQDGWREAVTLTIKFSPHDVPAFLVRPVTGMWLDQDGGPDVPLAARSPRTRRHLTCILKGPCF